MDEIKKGLANDSSTEFFENSIANARTFEELREIQEHLPKVSFVQRLDQLSEKYGIKLFKIQKETTISKSNFSYITNGTRKPQKYQIIQIGLAMGITKEEMNELLKLAGHKELYAKNVEDGIIIFGLKNKLKNYEIEELLIKENCKLRLLEE